MTGGWQPPAAGVHLHGEASEQGRNYLLGQGTMIVNEATTAAGPVAVVVPVVAHGVAASGVFVGRDGPVGELLGLLDPNRQGPGTTTVVSAVAGLAGVGKTALARHAASIAVGRGWFPGGAVLVDLHGYDPAGRVEAAQTFGPLLRALGVDGEEVPPVEAEQAAAYHQLLAGLAEQGRPVLLVLDNVSGPQQVADLLPAHRLHRVVVTSRHTLGDLPGAHPSNSTCSPRPKPSSCWRRSCGSVTPPTGGSPTSPTRPRHWPGCVGGCRWPCGSPPRCWPTTPP